MCGIVGMLTTQSSGHLAADIVRRMATAIVSRGPDSGGYWNDASAGIALGHRRLAIVDLTPTGAQPMASASGRYVLSYNGEVYNHLELRNELQSENDTLRWRGHSDTETIVACIEAWGISKTLQRAVGMFAFAVWDRDLQVLTLARDRLGEKPLYYGWIGTGGASTFVFGSQLKALKAHPEFSAEVDRGALALLLRHNYIPAPYSIYEGVSKLPPGCYLSLRSGDSKVEITTYWNSHQKARRGIEAPFLGTPAQAVAELDDLLGKSIADQMVADVPLGGFLSGGVDSSTVVALMQARSSSRVKTFTIGFDVPEFNEAAHAKAVAQHLGTEHTELYVTSKQALAVIPHLPTVFDEPFADSSQIPTFLVAKLAREHVTVSLSGDGGDELFCGYGRYRTAAQIWQNVQRVPSGMRGVVADTLTSMSPRAWNSAARIVRPLLPEHLAQWNVGDKVHKGAKLLGSNSLNSVYRMLTSHWDDPAAVVINGKEPPTRMIPFADELNGLSPTEQLMAIDLVTYLPDDILAKVDRAAMGVSLETRVPFLDHRVVEFAWQVPTSLKVREGHTKWILRQVLYRYVPKELIERPKMGFAVPLADWLRGPLRDWAEVLLDKARLEREGYFSVAAVRQKWDEHLTGDRNWAPHLWNILMFQAWLTEQ